MGASMACTMGAAPASLIVTSQPIEKIDDLLIATVLDCVPVTNIPPFGTCQTLTAAASGVPTPCVPAPTGPWKPGSLIAKINSLAVLTMPAQTMCGIGGCISITDAGQTVEVSD
jgi:hypothetical protein